MVDCMYGGRKLQQILAQVERQFEKVRETVNREKCAFTDFLKHDIFMDCER